MYLKISESLHNAPVVIAVELLSQRRYVPNVKSKYFIIAELVHNALVVMVAQLFSQSKYVQL